jgi:hypothetical protein
MSEKIIITGTGRCGTTFLMKIFSFLGMDTGYTLENYKENIDPLCNAGMEQNMSSKHMIIKNPLFMNFMDFAIKMMKIKYVIIPIRDYGKSAQSRKKIGEGNGGYWNASNEQEQISFYHKIMSQYLLTMVKYDIPTIFIDFEKMIYSPNYLYTQLEKIFQELNISKNDFNIAYVLASETSKPTKNV